MFFLKANPGYATDVFIQILSDLIVKQYSTVHLQCTRICVSDYCCTVCIVYSMYGMLFFIGLLLTIELLLILKVSTLPGYFNNKNSGLL